MESLKFMQKFSYMRQLNLPDRSFIDTATTSIVDVDTIKTSIVDVDTIKTNTVSGLRFFKRPDAIDIILLFLPTFALFLWSISLQTISLDDMNDLGLISALSPRIIIALGILVVSFAVTLQRRRVSRIASRIATHLYYSDTIWDSKLS